MTRNHILAAVTAAALLAGGAGAVAYASKGDNDHISDAALLAKSKISIEQAIAAAQTSTGGKALAADLGDENGHVQFDVTVVQADNTTVKVVVDPQTGKVVRTTADTDREGEHERE